MQPSHAISDLFFAPSRLGKERLAGAYAWQAVYMGLQWTEQGRATNGVDVHLSDIADDAERGAFYRDQSLARISSDPGFFVVQAARKFKVLWSPYLPEDSVGHKLVNAVYLLPLYALGILGWLRSRAISRGR